MTGGGENNSALVLFQSTLLMRGATRRRSRKDGSNHISIHAPHARSDLMPSCSFRPKIVFQSMLLMRGATRGFQHVGPERGRFQSMLLMRGATRWYRMEDRRQPDFNPRSSCEERPSRLTLRVLSANFNPRSSCEERQLQQEISAALTEFQSTLLMRGATL